MSRSNKETLFSDFRASFPDEEELRFFHLAYSFLASLFYGEHTTEERGKTSPILLS